MVGGSVLGGFGGGTVGIRKAPVRKPEESEGNQVASGVDMT